MRKILVIDDEKDYMYFLKLNLEAVGRYRVTTASNGLRGVASAIFQKPDLILLDIMMPGMNGFETLKRLKSHRQTVSIPVIMLTAVNQSEAQKQAAELFNEDYITKPIETKDLKTRIERVLSRA